MKEIIECLLHFVLLSKGLQSQMNSKIFSDLLEFFKRAHNVEASETERKTIIQEIPTAALITGEEK